MGINDAEYRSAVGLDSVYVAEVLQDDSSAYSADTPEYFAPAIEASIAPTTNTETQYADDKAYDAMVNEAETVVELGVTNIPAEILAKVLGKRFDATTGRLYDNAGTPPYYALGFRSQKSNGSYVYYWFLKGRFQAPTEDKSTKTDSPDPKTRTITFTALQTVKTFDLGDGVTDSVKRVVGDDDTDAFSETDWFTQVQVPGVAAVDALALSASDPADGAAAVAVDKTCTLTFNNKLTAAAIKNVVLVKADGTVVASAITINAAGKIITINPTGNLDAGGTYILAYAVVDIYGQALAGAANFGTA
jgi:phi13 family phage major tail protein